MCFVFCGVPTVCLYICNCVIKIALCFSTVVAQMFLTVPGAILGSSMATLTVASVFVEDVSRTRWGAIGELLEMFFLSHSIVLLII